MFVLTPIHEPSSFCFKSFSCLILTLILWLPPTSLSAQPQFSRRFATPPNGLAYFLETAPQHQQVLVREFSPWAGPGEFTILRLDSMGDPVANHRIGLTDSRPFLSPRDININPVNGEQLIAGWAQSDSILGDSFAGMAIKLDSNHQVLWANAIHADSATVRFTQIGPFTPGRYLAVGGVLDESPPLTDEDFFIAKLNAHTGLLEDYAAFGGNGGDLAAQFLYLPQQQQVFVVGAAQSFGTQHHGIYVMALDTGLNQIWSHVIDGPVTDQPTAIHLVNGELVIAGGSSGWSGASYDMFIARMSLSGSLLDFRTFELPGEMTFPYSVQILPSGNILMGGFALNRKNFILETDLLGQVQWAYTFPTGQDGLMANTHPDDKRIFMAEEIMNAQGNLQIVIWGLGSDGVYGNGACNTPITGWVTTVRQPTIIVPSNEFKAVHATDKLFAPWVTAPPTSWLPFCSAALANEEAIATGISVAPNPAGGTTKVTWETALGPTAELRLIDALGRVLIQQKLPEDARESTLDLSAFPSGPYWIQIRTSEGGESMLLQH